MKRARARAGFTLGASLALALFVVARSAAADPLVWNPSYPRFRPLEYVATGSFALASLALLEFSNESPWWKRQNSVDDAIRYDLRAHTPGGRLLAARVSDVLATMLVATPALVDPIVATARGSSDVAFQDWMINSESLSLSLMIHTMVIDLVGRERPFGRLCVDKDAKLVDCTAAGRYRSFFSGHTMIAFTEAGMICVQHASYRVYATRTADMIGCAVALSAASTVGLMRIVADRHYASDVFFGASLGALSGALVPFLLHYSGTTPAAPPPATTTKAAALVSERPPPLFFSYAGSF